MIHALLLLRGRHSLALRLQMPLFRLCLTRRNRVHGAVASTFECALALGVLRRLRRSVLGRVCDLARSSAEHARNGAEEVEIQPGL